MQFIAMPMSYRISNSLIHEQKKAAPADVRVRQHGFCECISGLDHPAAQLEFILFPLPLDSVHQSRTGTAALHPESAQAALRLSCRRRI